MSGIAEEVKTIIANIEGDIVAIGEYAWNQTKLELLTLGGELLGIIKADILAVVQVAENGHTVEEIETELLNLWAGNKQDIINALSSGALQLLITMARTAAAGL